MNENGTAGGKVERILLVTTSLFLLYDFVRDLFPIDEMPSPTVDLMSVAFELLMAFGVVVLGVRVVKAAPQGTSERPVWIAVMIAGIIGAMGVLGVRMSGGQRVELPPRPSQAASESSIFPPELEKLGTRMGVVMSAYQKAETAAQDARWAKTDASEYRKLPREVLKEYIARLRELVDATDQAIAMLAEPGFEANLARMVSIAEAHGTRLQKADLKPDALRILRRIYAGSLQVHQIIDTNWEEWRADSGSGNDPKPWQKELLALASDIRMADKELDALVKARAAQESTPQPAPDPQQVERKRIEAELKAAHASFKARWDNLIETRWAKTDSTDPREGQNASMATIIAGAIPYLRKLSREDLSEFRKAQRALLDSYEQVFSLFQKAQTNGFDPLNPGVGLAGWYMTLAKWHAARRVHAIAYEQSGLIEENWEDWRRSGLPKQGKLKPWQKKAQQLQTEFESAFKESRELN
jgi:hypothetical protein